MEVVSIGNESGSGRPWKGEPLISRGDPLGAECLGRGRKKRAPSEERNVT